MSMGGYREDSPQNSVKNPVLKVGYIDPTKKRGSFLKRRQLSYALTDPPKRRTSVASITNSASADSYEHLEFPFFQGGIEVAKNKASYSGPSGSKTVHIAPKWESSVYVTQILLSESFVSLK